MRTVPLALGGNALTREGQNGTEAGGEMAIITPPRRAASALAGTHGTRVVSDRGRSKVAAGA